MYLKSLELQGFKSFPDKVKLEFDKGITAVVGPNGSGKSNIGDAVRWVLGEQSSKTLRGGKMEDVIFAGTQSRKQVGFAAVTLNIDNTSKKLNCDNDVVSVTRKLYRSGESEYSINGKSSRLKDIVELFMDTGLGRDGYSIIGQGKIADIVSSKSNDRREIFEEAAGISKFRYKKQEAEKRLFLAEENLIRLRDIIAELEGRVEPLRIQSEKAAKFLEFSEIKKKVEISVWMHKISNIKESLNEFEDNFLIRTAEYESKESEIEQIEAAINEAYSNMQKSSVLVEKMRSDIHTAETENADNNANVAVLENDILHINSSITSYEDKIKQTDLGKAEITSKLELAKENSVKLQEKKQENVLQIENITKEFEDLNKNSYDTDKSFNSKNDELNKLYLKKSEIAFDIKSSEIAINEANIQKNEIENSLKDCYSTLEQCLKNKNDAKGLMTNLDEEICELNNKLNGYTKLLERKSEQLNNAKNEFSSINSKVMELKQKQKLLVDLDNNMEGFHYSVKEVVKAGKTGRIPGIKGSVGQLISVDSKYSVAIETALGASLQNIIVENEDTAKRCIGLLKEKRSGRATFLPMTSVKGYVLNENSLESQNGFISIASKLVKFDDRYNGIMNYLLGRIVIVEDINLATVIAKKYKYKFRIVTLDGQVINSGGSFTGGSVSKSTGVLTRKNEINNISSEIEKINNNYETMSAKVDNYQSEVDKLNIDIEGLKDQLNNVNNDKIRVNSEIKHLDNQLDQINVGIDGFKNNIKIIENKIINQTKLNKQSIENMSECEENIENIEKYISQTQEKLSVFQKQSSELSEKLSALKISNIEIVKDIEACENEITQLNKDLIDQGNSTKDIEKEINQLKSEIEQKEIEIKTKKNDFDNIKLKIEELNLKIKEEQKNHLSYEAKANEQRNFQKIKSEEKEHVSRELAKVTERKLSIQKEYDTIISNMWEQYQLSKSEAIKIAEEIDDINASIKQLNEIKGKIRNLGSVNVAAIEEYKEVSERYEFLSKQIKDVEMSKRELVDLIKTLTADMERIFTESFNQINDNFKEIFVELFGGGRAELVMTDPNNVLESGIEINVAPPGKVIKSLSLLSGGEQSFIAIAIYFAILKISPSPFCILDEIEAALDDVNVAKYAAYLRNFVDSTQFIVITHRRGTMEEADVLYGVTMQQKGISKLLKMDNRDVIDIDE